MTSARGGSASAWNPYTDFRALIAALGQDQLVDSRSDPACVRVIRAVDDNFMTIASAVCKLRYATFM